MSDVTERDQFSGAVQEIQTLFFNVFAKYENFESDQNKNTELIEALRTQLQYSEKKRSEIQAKYTNLRVKYERLRTSIKEAMTLNSPTPDAAVTAQSVSRLREKFSVDLDDCAVSGHSRNGKITFHQSTHGFINV